MGGCFSADSHRALASPMHKKPKDKGAKHNGEVSYYSPLANGGAHHHEDLIKDNSSIPLSTDSVVPTFHSYPTGAIQEGKGVVSTDSVVPTFHSYPTGAIEEGKGVAPSDSGIESLGSPQEESNPAKPVENIEFTLCQACHHKLQRISRGSCHQCGNFRLDTSELSAFVNADTYCTCGPRQPGRQLTCRTHGIRGKTVPTQRHSDVTGMVLKSSLKKHDCGRGDVKQVRMSWRSVDSLDMNRSMNTCMDRARSEASDVFGDDVSFRAPLAQFDSVDKQLNDEAVGDEECDASFLASRMSIYSEILDLADCICKCDFSSGEPSTDQLQCVSQLSGQTSVRNSSIVQPQSVACSNSRLLLSPAKSPVENGHACLEAKEDEDSGHGMSKSDSEDHSGSTSDSELEVRAQRSTSSNSSSVR